MPRYRPLYRPPVLSKLRTTIMSYSSVPLDSFKETFETAIGTDTFTLRGALSTDYSQLASFRTVQRRSRWTGHLSVR